MKKLGKRGVLDQLGGLVQALGFLAILLAIVFLVVAQTKSHIVTRYNINESSASNYTTAYNATNQVQNAMADIPGWLPIIVIAVIGGVLLTLIQFFRRR